MRLYTAGETSVLCGISVETLNLWYRFKKYNPDNNYAKMLPEIKHKEDNNKVRYWNEEDIYKLVEFKSTIPQGRNGVMGKITQKYVKKKEK